ncbi:MAG: hypothetical protein AAF481_11370 [Acidobacteriota bacterium]
MPSDENPPVRDFLDRLEQRRLSQKESFHESVSERRQIGERFRQVQEQAILPALGEVGRELERRGHHPKVRNEGSTVTFTVGVKGVNPKIGVLRFRLLDDPADQIRVDFEGVVLLQTRYRVKLSEFTRKLATRLTLHFTEALLKD